MSNTNVSISILGRDFTIACPENEQKDLLSAAKFLDENMKAIQKSGKVISPERCAIMAALNISNDLLKLQKNTSSQQEIGSKIEDLHLRVDSVLNDLNL